MARVGVSWSYYQNKLKVVYILLSQVDPQKKKKKKKNNLLVIVFIIYYLSKAL